MAGSRQERELNNRFYYQDRDVCFIVTAPLLFDSLYGLRFIMGIDVFLFVPVVCFAAFVMGFSGFGYGIVCMALLTFFADDPERVSVYVTLSCLVVIVTVFMMSRHRGKVDWLQVSLFFIGVIAGTQAGYGFILEYGNFPVFRYVFGIVLVAFAVNGLWRPHRRLNLPNVLAPVFGLGTGLLSGAFSSGGPPAVYYFYAQEEDPRDAISSLQVIFFGAGAARLFVIGMGERGFGAEVMMPFLWTAPLIIGIIYGARKIADRVSLRFFLWVVYVLLGGSGIVNIIKAATGGG